MKIEERENLSIPEVAELLKCSVVTVHNMRIRGDIVAAKLPNGRYRVHQSEVDRLLNTDGSRRANVAKRDTPMGTLGMTLDEPGMTLRDYFAGQALTGIVMHTGSLDIVVERCYLLADAMLEARRK